MVLSGPVARRPAGRDDRAAAAPVLRGVPVPPRVQVAAAARRTRCSVASSRPRSTQPVARRRRPAAPSRPPQRRARRSTVVRGLRTARRGPAAPLQDRDVRRTLYSSVVPVARLVACDDATSMRKSKEKSMGMEMQAGAEALAAAGDDTAAATGDPAAAALPHGAGRPRARGDAREPDPRRRDGSRQRAQPRARRGRRRRAGSSTSSRAAGSTETPIEGSMVDGVAQTEIKGDADARSTRSTGRTTSTTTRCGPPMPAFRGDGEELPSLEPTLTKPPCLHDHLAWQLKMTNLLAASSSSIGMTDPRQHRRRRLPQGPAARRARRRPRRRPGAVRRGAREDPEFDPIGVGARSLAECMLIQASPHRPGRRPVRQDDQAATSATSRRRTTRRSRAT